jgi:hypothetical protein
MLHTRVLAYLVAAATAIAVPLGAQTAPTRPNLLGKWTLVIEKSTPATPERNAREITIAQDGQMLTLTQFLASPAPPHEEAQFSTTYDCDGTEHPTKPDVHLASDFTSPKPLGLPSADGPKWVSLVLKSVYRAIWTRDQLVIVTHTTTGSPSAAIPNRHVLRTALSLDADGLLVVDSITISEPTPNGPSQPAPVSVHSVYRKAS